MLYRLMEVTYTLEIGEGISGGITPQRAYEWAAQQQLVPQDCGAAQKVDYELLVDIIRAFESRLPGKTAPH